MAQKDDKPKGGLHNGHRMRLRKKYFEQGIDSFEAHEVLELLLFYGIPRRDTNETAHELINRFGSLAGVFDADLKELESVNGVGRHAAGLLKLIPELSRLYISDVIGYNDTLNSTVKAGNFILPRFIGYTDERLMVVSLDGKSRVIGCDVIAVGTVNEVALSVRTVVEIAMKNKAVGVILAHNHPGGVAVPSNTDIETTWQIFNALSMVNVCLLDHIVVAGNEFVSMRESKKSKNIFKINDGI
ncbi:MAG: DNA repair protein RadC [Clostridia bacterium]|nr:DNA repair protein RadC [Clostridia bacterium]